MPITTERMSGSATEERWEIRMGMEGGVMTKMLMMMMNDDDDDADNDDDDNHES